MSVLIIGGSGFVGRSLVEFFSKTYDVDFTYNTKTDEDGHQLDITKPTQIEKVFKKVRPKAVINAAGWRDLRGCQQNQKSAREINTLGVHNLAMGCAQYSAHFIHLSDSQVFECSCGPYLETDLAEPQTVYGASKLSGEHFAIAANDKTTICRAGKLYGKDSPLISWIDTELRAKRRIEAHGDVINTPTFMLDFAQMIEAIMVEETFGVRHCAGRSHASRFEFIRDYARIFELDETLVVKTTRPLGNIDRPDSSLGSCFQGTTIGHVDGLKLLKTK